MRTQPTQRPRRLRRWVAGPALGLTSSLAVVTAAAGQSGGAGSGGDGSPSAALLLAGAALLLLATAAVVYALPARRRRRAPEPAGTQLRWHVSEQVPGAPARDDSAQVARHNDLTQMDRPTTGTGDLPRQPAGVPAPAAPWASPQRPSWPAEGSVDLPSRPASPRWPARRASPDPAVPRSGPQRALGYTTFPDRKRAVSPESRYQARRIRAACEARGMVLHQLVGDVQSYSGPDLERPGLTHALDLLAGGDADCLVVSGLDRLSRSAANLGTVIEWLDDIDARLVVIDIDLDTDTDEGRLAARALARVGALERRSGAASLVSRWPTERPSSGRRPAVADLPLLQRRIATMRASGMTLQAIADTLNAEGVPTLRGGAKWRPSSVQAATGYKRPAPHTDG